MSTDNEKVYPTTPRVNQAVRLAWVIDEAKDAFVENIKELSREQLSELYYRLCLTRNKLDLAKMLTSGRAFDLDHPPMAEVKGKTIALRRDP